MSNEKIEYLNFEMLSTNCNLAKHIKNPQS